MKKILVIGLLMLCPTLAQAADPPSDADLTRYPSHGKAIQKVKTALQTDPQNTDLLMELAKYYGWEKDQTAAIRTYEEVVALDPANLKARKMLVDYYRWNKMPEKSIEQGEAALKLAPDDVELMEKLGSTYMYNGRQADAEIMFNRILEIDPTNIKAKKRLADLTSYSSRHNEAASRYLTLLPEVTSREEKLNIMDKVSDNYYYARDYGKAREYAEEVLRLDPENEEALYRLRKIEEKFRPVFFTEYRNHSFKGDQDRIRYEAGATVPTEQVTVTNSYKYYRVDQIGKERYQYDAYHLELSKYAGDGLTVALGTDTKFYDDGKTRFDYYFRAIKDYYPGLRGDFLYRKDTKDAERDDLEQRVDGHHLSATFYQRINDWLSVNTFGEAVYYTQGNAFDDNYQFSGYVMPVFHLSKDPVINLWYQFYHVWSAEKDRNPVESFEYFAPRKLVIHNLGLYYLNDFNEHWRLILSDTVGWVDEEGDTWTQNTILGELIYRFSEDRELAVRYLRSRDIHNADPLGYKDSEWRVRFTWRF